VRPAFSGHPIAEAVFVASLLVWFAIEVRQALHRRPGATNTDRGSLMVVRLAAVAGALLAAVGLRVPGAAIPYSPVLMVVSLAFVWAGVALRWWSFRTLGQYFTFQVMTSADQPVIMSGPYRYLRHPSYTGILLILLGIGISYGSWLSLAAITLLPLAGFINRIRVEEAALASALGQRYTTYARGRKRLVPYVW
jgi:protein-S-isoprenylcysteine O-methyltransferase Ste14